VNSEFSRGLALHQQGRLADAESVHLTVLRHQPAHARAWHLLGVIAPRSGRPERAIQLIDKAIALNPDYAEAYNNRGAAVTEPGRHDAAVASHDRAVAPRRTRGGPAGVIRDVADASRMSFVA